MLHIVRDSPLSATRLEESLQLALTGDHLLLIQDGVIASSLPAYVSRFEQRGLHVSILAEDLLARGLRPLAGEIIDMAGFVRLVAEQGSPLRW